MNKQNIVVLAVFVVLTTFFISNNTFDTQKFSSPESNTNIATGLFHLPALKVPTIDNATVSEEAWTVFQKYLGYAKAHDLAGLVSLSHQLSQICDDPERRNECFALMDNVYEVASPFQQEEFKHVQFDGRQIIMSTDGPVVAILYFTRDGSGSPKMLGIGFCLEDGTSEDPCVETDPNKRDTDKNGWWDAVEALFK